MDAVVERDVRSGDLAGAKARNPLVEAVKPLVVEVGIPLGTYYLLRDVVGLGLVPALALSGVLPAVRTVAGVVRQRTFNGLAGLMTACNLAGIAASLVTGDARLMLAKDGAISSVVGLGILVAVAKGRPLMSAGLRPLLTRGAAGRMAAWDGLVAESARFRRLELAFSAIWGTSLLADCVARVVLAYVLPVSTMVWLSGFFVIGAIVVGSVIGIPVTSAMDRMIKEGEEDAR